MAMITCSCGGLTPIGASSACLHCDAPLRQPPRWALKLTALLGPAGAILLAACYGAPGHYYRPVEPGPSGATRVDRDGDGVPGPWECPQGGAYSCQDPSKLPPPPDLDCDDNDRARYPGAQDIDGDGVDQNCDGVDGWRDPTVIVAPTADGGVDAP